MTHWRLLTAATYLSALTSGIVEAASADDWKSRSIYQVLKLAIVPLKVSTY
jgi:hypothetical protein